MSKFAVIDTETTWDDAVMSIGMVIADSVTFELIDKRYYILTPLPRSIFADLKEWSTSDREK